MKRSEIVRLVGAHTLSCDDAPDADITVACASDLMSAVLSINRPDTILLTTMEDSHLLHTAQMLKASAILYVRGVVPSRDIIEAAEDQGMVLLATDMSMFTACGVLYEAGLRDANDVQI